MVTNGDSKRPISLTNLVSVNFGSAEIRNAGIRSKSHHNTEHGCSYTGNKSLPNLFHHSLGSDAHITKISTHKKHQLMQLHGINKKFSYHSRCVMLCTTPEHSAPLAN